MPVDFTSRIRNAAASLSSASTTTISSLSALPSTFSPAFTVSTWSLAPSPLQTVSLSPAPPPPPPPPPPPLSPHAAVLATLASDLSEAYRLRAQPSVKERLPVETVARIDAVIKGARNALNGATGGADSEDARGGRMGGMRGRLSAAWSSRVAVASVKEAPTTVPVGMAHGALLSVIVEMSRAIGEWGAEQGLGREEGGQIVEREEEGTEKSSHSDAEEAEEAEELRKVLVVQHFRRRRTGGVGSGLGNRVVEEEFAFAARRTTTTTAPHAAPASASLALQFSTYPPHKRRPVPPPSQRFPALPPCDVKKRFPDPNGRDKEVVSDAVLPVPHSVLPVPLPTASAPARAAVEPVVTPPTPPSLVEEKEDSDEEGDEGLLQAIWLARRFSGLAD